MYRSILLLLLVGAWCAAAWADEAIDFNRDIRPILSDNCFQCHGPDAAKRQAELRLDRPPADQPQREHAVVVAGDPQSSELFRRITSAEPDEHMPPADSGKKLTSQQVELIRRWIADSGTWDKHWAFLPPVRPALPAMGQGGWLRNPIDAFVLARLERESLSPAPEADRTTLLRRVTLDLTGLPPTPAEVADFLADSSPDAYERVVDRLLASPRYGERMAGPWLDAARYADTSGYQTDGPRVMWRWRDWTIEAFNRNLPFDQFTVEQLAGDLLPGATREQRIATGFHRNCRGNSEGGIIPEEYVVEYAVDRVETTATVWLGLTIGCARCHDHKFDPVTQQEFYQLLAFFNGIPERGRHIKVGNTPPVVKAPTRDEEAALQALDAQLAAAEAAFAAAGPELAASEARWAEGFRPASPFHWWPTSNLVAHFPLEEAAGETVGKHPVEIQGTVGFPPGRVSSAAAFDGASHIKAGDAGRFGYFDRFTLAAWIRPEAGDGALLARLTDQSDAKGYSIVLADGKLQVNLINRWLDDALRVESVRSVAPGEWHHVAVTYDGSREAKGVSVYVDGQLQPLKVLLDDLNQSFDSETPLTIGGGGAGKPFLGQIDEVRIYQTDLPADIVAMLADSTSIDAIAARAMNDRTPVEAAKLRAYFLDQHAAPDTRQAFQRGIELRGQKRTLEESFATVMVMEDGPTPRETFILERGQYDKPTRAVTAGTPLCLPPLDSTATRNRLALARWLTSKQQPLTARVAVNRYWQSYFGAGLVKTVDDFGAQGDPPSHPALLDWLAVEFVESGWDIKHMQRLIVSSATYRQSSQVAPQLVERDPGNRLLARGPRLRLTAAAIRDSALLASGLLVDRVGGPSVKTYQPPGLWKELTGGTDFEQDHGAALYRRSLYTFWKRTIAPPSMMLFDAAARDACTVSETRTNTPLQALALLNEVVFVEAARVLAARVLTEASVAPEQRLDLAFRLALARPPKVAERTILLQSLERQLARFRSQPDTAKQLLGVGEAPLDPRFDPAELAAYATVCNLILNLDEMVTKE